MDIDKIRFEKKMNDIRKRTKILVRLRSEEDKRKNSVEHDSKAPKKRVKAILTIIECVRRNKIKISLKNNA